VDISLSATTTGPDDAEAVAQVLEHAAAAIRSGGGNPVTQTGKELPMTTPAGVQTAFFSFTAV